MKKKKMTRRQGLGPARATKKQITEAMRAEKKKTGRPSAADGGKAAVKRKAKAGKAAKRQAEEEEQPASGTDDEAHEAEEEEAKPSTQRRGAAPPQKNPQKKRKSGDPLTQLQPTKNPAAKLFRLFLPTFDTCSLLLLLCRIGVWDPGKVPGTQRKSRSVGAGSYDTSN